MLRFRTLTGWVVIVISFLTNFPPSQRLQADDSSREPAVNGLAFAEKPRPRLPARAMRRLGSSAFRTPGSLLRFSPNSGVLAIGQNNVIRLVDSRSGVLLTSFQTEPPNRGFERLDSIAFSSDGRTLIGCGENTYLWDIAEHKLIERIKLKDRRYSRPNIVDFALSPNAQWRVTSESQQRPLKIKVAPIDATETTYSAEIPYPTSALAVSNDGKLTAASTQFGAASLINVWEAADMKRRYQLEPHQTSPSDLVFTQDATKLYGVCGGAIRHWKLEDGSELPALYRPAPSYNNTGTVLKKLALSDDGQVLVAYGERIAMVFDLSSGEEPFTLQPDGDVVRGLALSPDGKILAMQDMHNRTWLWSLPEGRVIHRPQPPIDQSFVSGDNKYLVAPPRILNKHLDPQVNFWNISNGNIEKQFRAMGRQKASVYDQAIYQGSGQLVFHNRERLLYRDLNEENQFQAILDLKEVGRPNMQLGDNGLFAYQPAPDRIHVQPFDFSETHQSSIEAHKISLPIGHQFVWVDLSQDGKTLAGVIRGPKSSRVWLDLWEAETGKKLRQLGLDQISVRGIAVSPGQKWVSAVFGNEIQVWNIETGARKYVLRPPGGATNMFFTSHCLQEDWVAVVASQRHIHLWNLQTGEYKKLEFSPSTRAISALQISQDGKRLAVARFDVENSVVVRELPSGKVIATYDKGDFQVTNIRFLPNADHLVLGGRQRRPAVGISPNGQLIWNYKANETTEILPTPSLESARSSIAVSSDGRFIGMEDQDGVIHFAQAAPFQYVGKDSPAIRSLRAAHGHVYLHQAKILAYQSGPEIRLIDLQAERELSPLTVEHFRRMSAVEDGKSLLVEGDEIFLWDGSRREERYRHPQTRLEPARENDTPAERLLLKANVPIRDIRTGEQIQQFPIRDVTPHAALILSPDKRLVFSPESGGISVFEAASGLQFDQLSSHGQKPRRVMPVDHQTLITEMEDHTALVWSLMPPDVALEETPNSAKEKALIIEREWNALRSESGERVYRAVWRLVSLGDTTVDYFRAQLEAADDHEGNREKIAQLIQQLGDSSAAERAKASTKLKALGSVAANQMRTALDSNVSLAVKARLRILLAAATNERSSDLLSTRQVMILEWIQTPAAIKLLKKLADEPGDSWRAIEARQALQRQQSRD